jgi:hypothetical protein
MRYYINNDNNMEDISDDSESLPLNPKPNRSFCFNIKESIEQDQSTKFFLSSVFGAIQFLHVWASLILLYVRFKSGQGCYSNALIPAIVLVMELLITCMAALFIVANDIASRRVKGITLWQRQAIGRLIKNIFVLSLIQATLVMFYRNADSGVINLSAILLPLLVLNGISVIRFLIISSKHSIFWVLATILALVQQILLIGKIDYGLEMEWKQVLTPSVCLCYLLCFTSIYVIPELRSNYLDLGLGIVNMMGCILLSVGLSIAAFSKPSTGVYVVISISVVFNSVGTLNKIGNYFIDIITGHIDLDVLNAKHPTKSLSYIPHSV